MKPTLTLKRLATAVLLMAGLGASSAFGQFAASGTTTLSVNVAAEASISIGTSTTNLTSTGTLFADYLGTTNFTYKVRTTQGSGSGTIGVQITADFAGAGGPSVANSGATGDTLTFTCASAASGTPCSSAQTSSTTVAKTAVGFGADARSAKAGDAGHVDWDLVNDPQYKTGSYSATATFTIAAV